MSGQRLASDCHHRIRGKNGANDAIPVRKGRACGSWASAGIKLQPFRLPAPACADHCRCLNSGGASDRRQPRRQWGQLVEAVDRIAPARGCPRAIRADNRLEFMSKALDRWAYANGVTLAFSRPGKPTGNTFVKPFNGRLRDESLNTHWFLSLDNARAKLKAWRRDLNETRPHTSLGLVTDVHP